MDKITLKEIFTTYWSQVTLVILGISYLFKIWIDYKYKKTEINHNLFQQKKLESLNNYFLIYSKAFQMWYDFPIYSVASGKLNANELDKMIFTLLNEMKRNVLELKIYFDEKDYKHFEYILTSFYNLNSKVKNVFLNSNAENINDLVYEFEKYKDEVFEQNEKTITIITEKIKKHYK